MERVCSFETMVTTYLTAWYNIPEDYTNINLHCHDNLIHCGGGGGGSGST
jgi:hypothetical protein